MNIVGKALQLDGVDRSTYTTTSISIAAGRHILIAVAGQRSSLSAFPTISGTGLSGWVQWDGLEGITDGGNQVRLSLHSVYCSSAFTGTLSIAWGVTMQYCQWSISEVEGGDLTNLIRAINTNTHEGSTDTPSIALDAFDTPANGTYGCFFFFGSGSEAAGSGFTLIHGASGLLAEWRADNDTSVDAVGNADGDLSLGIACELIAAPSNISVTPSAVSMPLVTVAPKLARRVLPSPSTMTMAVPSPKANWGIRPGVALFTFSVPNPVMTGSNIIFTLDPVRIIFLTVTPLFKALIRPSPTTMPFAVRIPRVFYTIRPSPIAMVLAVPAPFPTGGNITLEPVAFNFSVFALGLSFLGEPRIPLKARATRSPASINPASAQRPGANNGNRY